MREGVARTPSGPVRGEEQGRVWVFRGIPYARALAGPDRWRLPVPPRRWVAVREAVTWGPIAPQRPPVPGTAFPGDPTEWSEDCLSLNVWTPGIDDARRPVLVWVHGGGFTGGTGASLLYDGSRLAATGDVVVVTLNYRLGALGFLAHPALADGDGAPAANWGLLDQLAALRWVADTIGEFGGDPGNVTVFGESAGAMSIAALLAAPSAAGLFHRAVLQSGPPASYSARVGARRAERLAELVGAGLNRHQLAQVPAPALVEATAVLGDEAAREAARHGGLPLPFLPVVDGQLLDRPPEEAVARGAAAPVPLLLGTNRDETAFFSLADREAAALDDAGILRRLARVVGEQAAPKVIEAYRDARHERGEPTTGRDLWTAITTDLVFRLPTLALAEAHGRRQPATYVYLFDWESPFLGGVLGACHALEIPFVFGTVEERPVAPFAGTGAAALALSRAVQQAWLSFARTGDPSTEELGAWPAYDPVRRPTMVLGPRRGVSDDPRRAERVAWEAAGVSPHRDHSRG